MLAPDVKLAFGAGLRIVTVGGVSRGGGGASPRADGAQMTPSRSPSKVYSSIGESSGAVPGRATLLRIRLRADSGKSVLPKLSSFSHINATTPATCGDAILVPDSSTVPPPDARDKIPMGSRKHESTYMNMSSCCSPGADTVTPVPATNAPSVVKYDALSALMFCTGHAGNSVSYPLTPSCAVVLATAITSGYPAGTCPFTSCNASLPAATTTEIPMS